MKKWINKIFILITALLVTSCNDTANKINTPTLLLDNSLITTNYDDAKISDYTIDINAQDVKQKIDSNESFFLFYHSHNCGECLLLTPIMIRYVIDTRATLYSIDIHKAIYTIPGETPETSVVVTNENELQSLNILDKKNNNVFCNSQHTCESTPTLMFFNNGIYTSKQYGTANLLKYKTFKRFMDNHLHISKTKMIKDNISTSETNPNIIYYFNNDSLEKVELFKQIIDNDLDIILYDTSLYTSSIDSTIINYKDNSELIVTNTTTYDDIMAFI